MLTRLALLSFTIFASAFSEVAFAEVSSSLLTTVFPKSPVKAAKGDTSLLHSGTLQGAD